MPNDDDSPLVSYRVPTTTVDASVVCANGAKLTGRLFLASGTTFHTGPLRPEERLNDTSAFLPFLADGASRAVLLSKREIVLLVVPARDAQGADDLAPPPDLCRVVVTCQSGTIEGAVALEVPGPQGRLLDHLNRTEPFLIVEREGDRCLVNKAWIAQVAEEEG